MAEIFSSENLVALLTLTALEIVLGIDNIIFISILVGKLPASQRKKARQLGLFLAMFIRIGLLMSLNWVMSLTAELFNVMGHSITGQALILLVGGLFLIGKSTWEIHDKLEGGEHSVAAGGGTAAFGSILVQILLLDIVFSLDSVITAVGMAQHIGVMITAVVIAVVVMLAFAGAVSDFVERHPTIKMLALSFLILIGVLLVSEGMGKHVEKGYVYFAMAFSLVVEMLNIRLRKKAKPVELRHTQIVGEAGDEPRA